MKILDIFYKKDIPLEQLQGVLDFTVEDWKKLEEEEQEEFRSHIQSFIRLYGYITQIVSFKDISLEKLFIFLRFLNKKLPKRTLDKLTDVVSSVDLESFRLEKKTEGSIIVDPDPIIDPIGEGGSGSVSEEPTDYLSNIIQILNENYGGELTDDDKVNLFFSACDLVVLPYQTASQSGIIPIAYQYNKLVLGSNIKGIEEFITYSPYKL